MSAVRKKTLKPKSSKPIPGPSGSSMHAGRRRSTDAITQVTESNGDLSTVLSENTNVSKLSIQREAHHAHKEYFSASTRQFRDYLDKTKVERIVSDLLKLLLDRPELPYNPYPRFCGRVRRNQERFHIEQIPGDQINAFLNNPVEDTYITGLKTSAGIWGKSSIMRVVNPKALSKYQWLISSLTPRPDELHSTDGYTNHAMVALIGPCVFDGSLYPAVHQIDVRVEYEITETEDTEAKSLYVQCIRQALGSLVNSEYHLVYGIYTPSKTEDGQMTSKSWENEEIGSDGFGDAVGETLQIKSNVYVDCVFSLDETRQRYIRGKIEYGLNFVELERDGIQVYKSFQCFCEYPMASFHEGVFFNQDHAEAYMSMSLREEEKSHASDDSGSLGGSTSKQMTQENGGKTQFHHTRMKGYKRTVVEVDGFKEQSEKTMGPNSWHYTTPIKGKKYQNQIAGLSQTVDLFEIVYSIIILILMDREDYGLRGDAILIEVYRTLHATAGRVYLLMEHNKSLRLVINMLADAKSEPLILHMLKQYKREVEDIFLHPLSERSQDHVNTGKVLVAKVEDMIYCPHLQFGSRDHIFYVIRELRKMNIYVTPLAIELAEDSLELLPAAKNQINLFQEAFPEDSAEPSIRLKEGPSAGEDDIEEGDYTHGIEDKDMMRHQTSVINVEVCKSKERAPKEVVTEVVLMRYLVDCRFDEVWSTFLMSLVEEDCLPPNPFPRLISALRQAAIKMEMFYEKASSRIERLVKLKDRLQLSDRENYVYNIPGLSAYGTYTSLILLDTGMFASLTPILEKFSQNSYVMRRERFQVAVCLCMSGPCVWYGQMQPYFNEIEIHEHYYVQGPSQCKNEAMKLCAEMVWQHLDVIISKREFPVLGVYFGDPDIHAEFWNTDDIVDNKAGFMSQFVKTCAAKQPIHAKAYALLLEWRYVTLTKHFILHYLDKDGNSEVFFPYSHGSFYQSVFLSKDRASFHYQNMGPPRGGDPLSHVNAHYMNEYLGIQMYEAGRKCDWLHAYRLLLLRDLIAKDDSRLADCWGMFHSMAGQAEYVADLLGDINDLVTINLLQERKINEKRKAKEKDKTPPPTPEDAKKPWKSIFQQKKKKKVKAKKEENVEEEEKLIVDPKVFAHMSAAFDDKFSYMMGARSLMGADSLKKYADDLLKPVLIYDPVSGQPTFAKEDAAVTRLDYLRTMMKFFQHTLSNDVHSVFNDIPMTHKPQRLRTPVFDDSAELDLQRTHEHDGQVVNTEVPDEIGWRVSIMETPKPPTPPTYEEQFLDEEGVICHPPANATRHALASIIDKDQPRVEESDPRSRASPEDMGQSASRTQPRDLDQKGSKPPSQKSGQRSRLGEQKAKERDTATPRNQPTPPSKERKKESPDSGLFPSGLFPKF